MLRPGIAFSLLIATCSLANAQDLTKQITYRTVAVPIHKALDEISSQTNLKLFASDELQDEPVILKLTHVSAQEFMDRFASIVGGEWTDRGSPAGCGGGAVECRKRSG